MEKYFACYIDSELREKSSSGGIYPAIADYVLNKSGIVYASVYNEDFSVSFRRIDNKTEITKTYGSKYVQSSLGDTFKNIKKDLECKSTVLFCGTHCQVAGLKAYLDKERIDYSNLYTIDLFCHGVPSNKVWQKYLAQKKDGKQLKSVNMRSKKSGWSYYSFSFEYLIDDKKEYILNNDDTYMKGFIRNLYLRPSCYSCKFKGNLSSADITLGDFWGVDRVLPNMDDNKGTSSMIIRTDKGTELLNALEKRADLVIEETDYNSMISYNNGLIAIPNKHDSRKRFFNKLDSTDDIFILINSCLSVSPLLKFKNRLKNKLCKVLKIQKENKKCNKNNFVKGKIYDKSENCSGCTACQSICPKNAISMREDAEGFFYPDINSEKCIKCKKCLSVCPIKCKI